MSTRALIIVACLLAVFAGLAFIGARPDSSSSSVVDSVFAPALAARLNSVESLVIRRAGNEVVATIDRSETGWRVRERGGYLADEVIVLNALQALADARIIEPKTSNPDLWYRLGLADVDQADATGIAIAFAPTSLDLPEVVLGEPEGTRYRYARLMGAEQSFLINVDPQIPTVTSQWLVTEILKVEGQRVERVVINHADGEVLDIFKSTADQANYQVADIPEGRELQYPGVANVIASALRDLQFEDVAAVDDDDEPAMGEPVVMTEYQTFDGLLIVLSAYSVGGENWLTVAASVDSQFSEPGPEIGQEAESINNRVSGWRYKIPTYQYGQLTRRMDDLLSAASESE